MSELGPRERLARAGRLATGRWIGAIVTRAPFMWPLLRGSVREFFDSRAEGWDERTTAGSAGYLAPLAAAMLHVAPAPERALDIGTGTGTGAVLIATEFPSARVRGVDLSEEMVRLAQRRVGLDPEGRIAFKVADASSLPWPEDSFDLVTQLNMPPFYGEISRVLRPGGQVVVASSWGPSTPFHVPAAALRRGFQRQGFIEAESGTTADGEWFVARLGESGRISSENR